MTAKDIQAEVSNYYLQGAKYIVPNCYFFGNNYCETDLLIVKDGKGFVYDIEVKISRSDFFADFKKTDKHMILEHGKVKKRIYDLNDTGATLKYNEVMTDVTDRPNRFYFAVPAGLVEPHEVPKYAGLLYVMTGGGIRKVKEAPMLHKYILEVEKKLCMKFYYYWKNALDQLKQPNQQPVL